ncbi:hypothetical protein E1A91_D03G082000v1 [Gossypium mustelinum]|uniref:Uncharacterized protein n=1 Tax=Gossypium mustelinum TaxID=34275 RepID=A0A5D2VKL3_GOSMU|nr:hypothetical protein E1A91_D03G082000v1 [Gossypium mustelinum]
MLMLSHKELSLFLAAVAFFLPPFLFFFMVSHFTICCLHHGDREKASLFTSFILPASSFGFLFSSDAIYDFDGQPPDLKKQELLSDATEDLQEAI